ncbi:radical SAM domain-containing protein [Calothrix sp. NIES-4071]|nr:radical SAM domain-containing protein [Calothrix sp. NIES-4071]BAZ63010.1 radical SAM domain-containing protein [Calothrix sp. NIES-4105]
MSSSIITYSPAYTIVPTYECFNKCTYCNFRAEPGKSPWMTLSHAEIILKKLQAQLDTEKTCEILILSGEVHPQSARRQAWFERIYELCELALLMGFLPHTNAGPLSFDEMQKLKQVNVSMGLMLEQLTPELLNTVHKQAPSKVPSKRLQQLQWAGELKIPFTTGLLLGIGEIEQDWWDTLEAIAQIHSDYHHIQEVILQPHSPGTGQSLNAPPFDPHHLPYVISTARKILPADITIQIPPNLVPDQEWLIACIEAGACDLGGIGPLDEVNPDYPHLQKNDLERILKTKNWRLQKRLPIYPQFDGWLNQKLQTATAKWRQTIN